MILESIATALPPYRYFQQDSLQALSGTSMMG